MVHGMHEENTGKDEGGAIIVNEDEELFSVCSEPTEHTGEILDNVEIEEELYWKTTCCICYEKFAVEVKTKCNHKFCSSCVTQIYHGARNDGKALQCPYCRGDLTNEILDYEFTLHNNLAELSTDTIQNTLPTLTLCSNVTIDDVSKWLECPGIDINHMNVFTALTSAATKGNLDVLNVLIANGADVESTTMVGETPLMMAALYGHVDIIKVLLKKKAKVDKLNLHGCSALHLASKIGNVEIIQLLIDSGEILDLDTLVNAQTNDGLSALHLATSNITIVEILIEHEANVNLKSDSYGTPIFMAAGLGHLDVVQYLIKKKAEINLTTTNGTTLLMTAASRGYFEIVKALLGEKAEVNAQTRHGLSALHLATANINIVKMLIEHEANVNLKSEINGTPIFMAAGLGHLDVVQYLIKKKADINITTTNGETPLMYAVNPENFEIVKVLLREKAEVNAQTNDGLSALLVATYNIAIVEILIEHGANIDIKSDIYGTPIYEAARSGHLDVVQYLIEKKADINVSTTNGGTPLMVAAEKGHFEIVKELQKANPKFPILKQRSDGQSALSLAELNGHTLITEFLCEIKDKQKNAVGKKAIYFLFWFMVMTFFWNLFFKKE